MRKQTTSQVITAPTEKNINFYAIGDTHGNYRYVHEYISYLDRSIIFHVGDFGIGFDKLADAINLAKLNSILERNKSVLIIIRGNHDNPFPWKNPKDTKTKDVWNYSNICFAKDWSIIDKQYKSDGSIWHDLFDDDDGISINDLKVLLVGGEISIDRLKREDGVSYWKDEITSDIECGYTDIIKLKNHDNWEPNLIVTHGCVNHPLPMPSFVYSYIKSDPNLASDIELQKNKLRRIIDIFGKKQYSGITWIYGHYHKYVQYLDNGFKMVCIPVNERYAFCLDHFDENIKSDGEYCMNVIDNNGENDD